MNTLKFVLFVVGFALASCQVRVPEKMGTDNPKPETKSESPALAPNVVEPFNAELVPMPAPNAYEVKVTWKLPPEGPWVLQREIEGGSRENLIRVDQNEGTYQDKTPRPGQTYRYRLSPLEPLFIPFSTRAIKIPRDVEINTLTTYSEFKGIQRLFLRGKIRSATGNVIIEADEIVSERGQIESQSEDAGLFDYPGRIRITARKATGELRIIARGTKGTDSVGGLSGTPGEQGAPGTPAEIEAVKKSGPFAFGLRCKKPPGNGMRGGKGGTGWPGEPGGNGTNSASIFVQIQSPEEFRVSTESLPGLGGKGGKGGAGGPGGPGGNPGAVDEHHTCPPALPGEPGPKGDDAPDGHPGRNGAAGAICLKLGSRTEGDCEKFKE